MRSPVDFRSVVSGLVLALLSSGTTGCGGEASGQEVIERLRLGAVPNESVEQVRSRYAGLVQHLQDRLGIPCELIVPETYGDLIDLFEEGEVELAYFGGYSFVLAHERCGALPLVMREIDTRYTSYFLVRADNEAETIHDLRGGRIAFGSELSNSGHLMPRHFLGAEGIDPDAFFSEVRHSGTHDKTAQWVRDGVVDVGAANAHVIREMVDEGRLSEDEVRVLWETPPFSGSLWVIRPELAATLRQDVRDAFLVLSPDDPQHAATLASLGAQVYLPASIEQYDGLRGVVRDLELLD